MDCDNPFALLISKPNISDILENIFLITLNAEKGSERHLYLQELNDRLKRSDLDLEVLQDALFDRLFMCNDSNINPHETQVVKYLFECYLRTWEDSTLNTSDRQQIFNAILHNLVNSLSSPEMYDGQNLSNQLLEQLRPANEFCRDLFKQSMDIIRTQENGEATWTKTMTDIFFLLGRDITSMSLVTFNLGVFDLLHMLTMSSPLCDLFLDVTNLTMAPRKDLNMYMSTPLCALLNLAILPASPLVQTYEHFNDPTDLNVISSTEKLLWDRTAELLKRVHKFLMHLIVTVDSPPEKGDRVLRWFGNFLDINCDRRKLWNAQNMGASNISMYATDGFMVNLGHALLKLCQPFCIGEKILRVDPTYCGVVEEECQKRRVHLPKLQKNETFMVMQEENSPSPPVAKRFKFITECFYMAHKAIELGYRVVLDNFVHLSQEVAELERSYMDARALAMNDENERVKSIKTELTIKLSKYLSMRAQLSDPQLLSLLTTFISKTAYWLNQVAIHIDLSSAPETFAPISEMPIVFPISDSIPETCKYIPEMLVENIVDVLVSLRRTTPKKFEELGYDALRPILTCLLIHMGSAQRTRNPHLRARLAEALSCLLPVTKDYEQPQTSFDEVGWFERRKLFEIHEHRQFIVPNLLSVFVSIERTGQSVEFEQKFNYRQHMYQVMDYLLEIEAYQAQFVNLAEEAEQHMEDVQPPLFLQFINLLLNDAVFLLDESFTNMAAIREMQQARANGQWNSLPLQERIQNEAMLHRLGMLAKFDNVLGRETIKTLSRITSKTDRVFTHPTMVDRVAGMLNYFLLTLVGPNQKNFKVLDKHKENYYFDPGQTVRSICQIYINLKHCDRFCLAVSQDGRSYRPELFKLTEDVLVRVGGGELVTGLLELSERVIEQQRQHQAKEDVIADAPDHFLDPIMSTLMTDPVILPSSKQTVDRTTIARHLLSDQTDPFNRAPLSMDQVIPNEELAQEIRAWLNKHNT